MRCGDLEAKEHWLPDQHWVDSEAVETARYCDSTAHQVIHTALLTCSEFPQEAWGT